MKRKKNNHWLLKSEPSTYGIDDLEAQENHIDYWDGVRNYQARNMIRDQMQPGDQAFFYHSACETPGIVGLVEIVSAGYPDLTALDRKSPYFDPKATEDNQRWYRMDVKLLRRCRRLISLGELRRHPELDGWALVRKGNRLSILPVSPEHWDFVLDLEKTEPAPAP